MKQKERLIAHGLFRLLAFSLLMLLPIGTWAEDYGLTVGGVAVTDTNASDVLGDGTVSFAQTNAEDTGAQINTLTLSSATLNGPIIYSGTSDLTIKLSGINYLYSEGGEGNFPIRQSGAGTTAPNLNFEVGSRAQLRIYRSWEQDNYHNFNSSVSGCKAVGPTEAFTYNYKVGGSTYEAPLFYTIIYGVNDSAPTETKYGFTVGSDEVSDLNIGNIKGASYDPDTKTLSLDNAVVYGSIESASVNDEGLTMTINLTGESQLEEGFSYYYDHDFTFTGTGSLAMPTSSISSSTKFFGVAGEVSWNTSEGEGSFSGDETKCWKWKVVGGGSVYNQSSTTTIYYEMEYGLTVNGTSVTSNNRTNVLNDNNATVQFDGKNTLILNGATTRESGIETTLDNLTIYLIGENEMEGTTLVSSSNQANVPTVTFTTDDLKPGKLTFTRAANLDDISDPSQVFSGVTVKYNNDLAASLSESDPQIVTIQSLLNPIVDEIETKEVNVINDLTGETIPDNGIVLDNVLYTLAADGDGVVSTESSVALTSAMNQDAMTTLAANLVDGTVVPGTTEFADAFKGITFKLPAGTGTITVDARLAGTGVLNVKIGTEDAKTFTHDDAPDFTKLEVPFACTTPTYVLIYNTTKPSTSRFNDDHRAPGRKETTTAEIRGLAVRASLVSSSPAPPVTPMSLSASDIHIESNHVTVSNGNIASIEDTDVFNALDGRTDITYVDLSATKIADVTVDRSQAPYNQIPASAMIYLPAGNMVAVGSQNVVIGTVCQNMTLSDAGPFEAAKDFVAIHATQARDYSTLQGKNCTVYLPFALDQTTAKDLGTFYKLKAVTGTTVTMESVEQTEANVPYMFKPSANTVSASLVMVKKDIPEAPPVSNTTFVGTYTSQSICSDDDYNYYCFMSSGADAGKFVRVVDNPMTVNPFRAYIKTDKSSGARELTLNIGGGGATGISMPQIPIDQSDVYYDLNGHRYIGKPVMKGIYIHNGRKEVVK